MVLPFKALGKFDFSASMFVNTFVGPIPCFAMTRPPNSAVVEFTTK